MGDQKLIKYLNYALIAVGVIMFLLGFKNGILAPSLTGIGFFIIASQITVLNKQTNSSRNQ